MATAAATEKTDARYPSYRGVCAICGETGEFHFGAERSVREGYACPHCRFALRWRDQASLILDEFGNGQTLSLVDLVESGRLDDVAIYEPALRGPFARHFRNLPRYTRSYFWPDRRLGTVDPAGVRNEDLTRLTLADDSFDLVITSDVMEHLLDIDAAFAEIQRILKPGGVHIFSIPTGYPLPDETVARVELKDGEEIHLLPPIYHNAGDGTPCLVYHDYGADLPARIDRHGGRTRIVRRSGTVEPCVHNASFITRAPASGAGVPDTRDVPARQGAPSPAARDSETTEPLATECPLCGNREFESFNGRPNARCSKCRSVERHRLMWMVIQHFDLFRRDLRVLHLAPEGALARRFQKLLGDSYFPCELEESRHGTTLPGRRQISLCNDLADFPDKSFDLIIHSHVLENLKCDLGGVLRQMKRILADDGHHLMSEPIRAEFLDESPSQGRAGPPAETPDHPGQVLEPTSANLTDVLEEVWGPGRRYFLDPLALFGEERLKIHCIPQTAWTGSPNSQGVFYNRAPEREPKRVVVEGAPQSDHSAGVRPVKSTTGERPFSVSTVTTDIATGRLTKRREQTAEFILREFAPAARYPRLVDLGAGSCHFAKLAWSLGHSVTAIDVRAARLAADLEGVVFRQDDVRKVDLSEFDAVLILGLLYHLEAADQVALLARCPPGSVVIIDTQIYVERIPGLVDMLGERISMVHDGVLGRYDGVYYRDKGTAMASTGEAESFLPSEGSLLRMLDDTGFRSVMQIDAVYYSTAGARRWYVAHK